MRRRALLLGLTGVWLVACGGGEDRGARARHMVDDGATLLDVRSVGEWSGGHIEGALHIPVSELSSRIAEVPSGAPVVVYCQSGVRSAMAAQLLESEGYEVFDLGSMRDWSAGR
ncbi:MAG: rhodanese-like domain-containing protein [Sandaracinaceae bacterium]